MIKNNVLIVLAVLLHFSNALAQHKDYQEGLNAYKNGDNHKAVYYFDLAVNAFELSGDTLTEIYADIHNYKASALYRSKETNNAISTGKKALALYKKLYGKSSSKYAAQCVNLATYFYDIGQYGMAISYENYAIKSYEKQNVDYLSTQGFKRLKTMFEQAKSEDIDIKIGFNPEINMEEVFDTDVQRKWEYGSDIQWARKCQKKVDIMYSKGDTISLDYLHAIDDLVLSYIAIKDNTNAAAWIEYDVRMKNHLCGKYSLEACYTLYLYALTAFNSGDMVTANDRANDVLKIMNEMKEHDNETFLKAMILRCSSYLHMGVLGTVRNEALRLIEYADSIFGKNSRQYDTARFQLAQYMYRLNENVDEKIVPLLKECLKWRTAHLGENHPDTVNALLALAYFLCGGEESEENILHLTEAEQLYEKFYELQVDNIKNNFLSMTLDEQRDYWHWFIHYYQDLIPQCVLKKWKASGKISIPSTTCYNAALFSKGLLLCSEVLMREALQQSLNSQYLNFFNDISQGKMELMELDHSYQNYNETSLKNLRKSINKKQQQLANAISSFSDYTEKLSIDWKEIQHHLGPTDAAIEFINVNRNKQEFTYLFQSDGSCIEVPSGVQKEDRYVAVILTRNTSEPIMLPLFDFNDIGELYFNYTLRDQYLSGLIWKPIIDILGNNIKDIYFSPSGELYCLPIESLRCWDDESYLSNRIKLHRLTSTRQLINVERVNGEGSVIYGGLYYDVEIKNQLMNSQQKGDKGNNTFITKESIKLEDKRGAVNGLPYLQGTKDEADIVYNLLINMSSTSKIMLLEGDKGTEASFKALNGMKNKIIHIGTHGYFISPNEDEIMRLNRDDLSMIYSGLYMAGADNNIMGRVSGNHDEGIMTSEEISHLDLRGLDMLTLSACQTGLGTITGDGVFGLQRGFKKAGANSILMSLWKVDDKATCLLMTEFYNNWVGKKMTKHNALEQAKQTVRSHKDNEWDDPKYWAAFILLDGLD